MKVKATVFSQECMPTKAVVAPAHQKVVIHSPAMARQSVSANRGLLLLALGPCEWFLFWLRRPRILRLA
ncbi:hypothetical protein LGH82_24140 [Mesorhizobium sp. PAMC28654]|uniref:hypothetical protein n=1 Tax=Mesorhizobium sp. PAMC28654 TaxID=2880934 RepID=UPI001D0B4972|nr:hypothetical protein [Mesorhizobium sp. PAMC28654]UDL88223.1 hypothetical protein LGH82_24140 [Mesorhizobium sp. PAMC28654]